MFTWALQLLAREGLLSGGTIGVDATTLEANAAMRSLVRCDSGEGSKSPLRRLALESGNRDADARAVGVKIDKKRKKKASNKDWKHPLRSRRQGHEDVDGRSHLAHKAEHAVDLQTGAVVASRCKRPTKAIPRRLKKRWSRRLEQLEAAAEEAALAWSTELSEVVADKGYHSNRVLTDFAELDVRSYVSEPHARATQMGRPNAATRRGVLQSAADQRQARQASDEVGRGKVERSFAHCYETGMDAAIALERPRKCTRLRSTWARSIYRSR